jgi:PhzF family phenazine biosynthesis protein
MTALVPAVLVEAFSEHPCSGNGAAVVGLPGPASAAAMQALARSFNQSETAFLLPCEGGWLLRWFTPSCEVPLCGHATLAALRALAHWQELPDHGSTTFHTRSGPLPVQWQHNLARISLPTAPLQPEAMPAALLTLLAEHLASEPLGFWRSGLGYSVVLLPPQAPLADAPAQALAQALGPSEGSGLVLMQALDPGNAGPQVAGQRADYQLRFLAPALGIAEDPVTGSAHALVAPYWMEQLGRRQVVGWQCSSRPGGMRCEATSSGMIRLIGSGTVLWSGSLHWQPDSCSAASGDWQALVSPV